MQTCLPEHGQPSSKDEFKRLRCRGTDLPALAPLATTPSPADVPEAASTPEGQPPHTLPRVDLHDATGPLLQTSVAGDLVALSAAQVRRAFVGTPFMTLGVILRIHWQAARLWLKRVPFLSKPQAPQHFVSR